MWQYNYTDEYLCHWGVKGMKWGVRRYQNEDGSLTPAGIKRYATKGYAEDAYKQNKSIAGKLYDKYTGAHKISGNIKYDTSTKAENERRAKEYLRSKNKKGSKKTSIRSLLNKTDNRTTLEKRYAKVAKTNRIAFGAKLASTALNQFAKYEYSKFKDNSSPAKAAIVNGSAYTSKILDEIGNITFMYSRIQQYTLGKRFDV